jgi:polar amino acid transport system substrate-binding protein
MTTSLRHACLPLIALLCGAGVLAAPGEMIFIAPTNHTMPLAQFADGELRSGILKDLGEAIAARLGLRARFLSVPSKRVGMVLTQGEADGICYLLPQWVDGQFDWSRPLIPNGGLIVARPDAPTVHKLAELAGSRIGTVIGYRYPQLETALGARFVRDDAPSMQHIFSKLEIGRTQYAIIEEMTLAYYVRQGHGAALRKELQFASFKAQCAFSRASKIPFSQVDQAINAIADTGGMDAIMARYR